jgi:hypothetical protein
MKIVESTSEYQLFENVISEPYAQIYTLNSKNIIACKLSTDYVPIEDFKRIFLMMSDLIKSGQYKKFIFDKRALRAFHQPSMEWYYLEWKKSILDYGVNVHRKILPDEPWFEKMVFVAKEQILQAHPNNIIQYLDIRYCKTLNEAIDS